MRWVPLEGIEVRVLSDGRCFELKPNASAPGGGMMKSLRMGDGAAFTKGNHKSFIFRVVGATTETAAWVQAVEKHAVAHQERTRLTSRKSSRRESFAGTFSFFRGKTKKAASHKT